MDTARSHDDLLTEYTRTIAAGATFGFSVVSSRSFLVRSVVNASGGNTAAYFKVGHTGNMPASFVTLAAGINCFMGTGFDRIEINNPQSVAITVSILVSPQLLSDSRVYGSVTVANGTLPKTSITDPDVLVPILTSDFRTQLTTNLLNRVSWAWNGAAVSLLNASMPYVINVTGALAAPTAAQAFVTFPTAQYVESIGVYAIGSGNGGYIYLGSATSLLFALSNASAPVRGYVAAGTVLYVNLNFAGPAAITVCINR